jgi:hypothetical protein
MKNEVKALKFAAMTPKGAISMNLCGFFLCRQLQFQGFYQSSAGFLRQGRKGTNVFSRLFRIAFIASDLDPLGRFGQGRRAKGCR